MNKQKFTQLVRDYHDISMEDRQKLHELVANFPYSQIIHTLVAKANMDAHTDIAKQTLGYAAMYAADRGVLKEIIDPKIAKVKPVTPPPQKKAAVAIEKTEPKKVQQQDTQVKKQETLMPKGTKVTINESVMHPGMQPLRDQILADLQALKESKATYMHWLNLPNEPLPSPKTPTKTAVKEKKASAKATDTKKKAATKSAGTKKSTKKASPTKKKASSSTVKLATKVKEPAKKAAKPSAKKTSAKPKTNIASKTTKEIKKKNQPDQAEIIDNFISKEPSITAKASRKSPNNQEDLSQHSTEFTEGLVSENLARIMVAQGKTDKAIDIYKKLIWKFPQKKAYFASQIEELKN